MAAVSQLADFARSVRPKTEPGVVVFDTDRYVIRLIPTFPIPGPNSVSYVRCETDDVDGVVREVEATFAPHHVPYNWVLDPEVQPPDLAERLSRHGFVADPNDSEAAVMILPEDAPLAMPDVNGMVIHDSLRDLETFRDAERVAAEAFAGLPFGEPMPMDASREQRWRDATMAPSRRGILATIDGEPAGSCSLTLMPPHGAIINSGAVRPIFRGRGVYRAMVARRLEMAREAGCGGLVVWGGRMSAPILEKLGFEKVSWRRFYVRA